MIRVYRNDELIFEWAYTLHLSEVCRSVIPNLPPNTRIEIEKEERPIIDHINQVLRNRQLRMSTSVEVRSPDLHCGTCRYFSSIADQCVMSHIEMGRCSAYRARWEEINPFGPNEIILQEDAPAPRGYPAFLSRNLETPSTSLNFTWDIPPDHGDNHPPITSLEDILSTFQPIVDGHFKTHPTTGTEQRHFPTYPVVTIGNVEAISTLTRGNDTYFVLFLDSNVEVEIPEETRRLISERDLHGYHARVLCRVSHVTPGVDWGTLCLSKRGSTFMIVKIAGRTGVSLVHAGVRE